MTRRPRFFAQLRNPDASAYAEAQNDHDIITRRLQSLERRGPLRAASAIGYTPDSRSPALHLATGRP